MKPTKKLLKEILLKLANGFTYTETIEEYAPDKTQTTGEDLVLIKRKITTHYVAPDMLAIKMLFENDQQKVNSLSSMTDEELVALKNKLIKQLVGGGESATN